MIYIHFLWQGFHSIHQLNMYLYVPMTQNRNPYSHNSQVLQTL